MVNCKKIILLYTWHALFIRITVKNIAMILFVGKMLKM